MKRWYGFCGIVFSLCVGVGCVWEEGKGLGNWRCKRLNGHDDFNGYVVGRERHLLGANLFELQH